MRSADHRGRRTPAWPAGLALLASILIGQPALACFAHVSTDLNDIKFADIVVVGHVRNYRVVSDVESRRKMLDRSDLPPQLRALYSGSGSVLSDYARFDIEVDRVLAGNASPSLSATWDNSTFREPETMDPGPYLIALRNPNSPSPPLRGPSATVSASPEPDTPTVLQAPCAGAFIFKSTSDQARTLERMLAAQPR